MASVAPKMSWFKITLIRSGIGMTERQNGVLKALGLRHRMKTVYHPVSPDTAGMIMKVKELLAVSEVDKPLTQAEIHAKRQPPKGYYIEKQGIAREDIRGS
ncbi:mitochondrial 54S ribosomal protein YmL33 [Tuber borchii]|uniref:Large ribosomal subunit protein uL30m n=1 Tax=Tuber borchii TaxID=42251 RepID=A0A2T6ZPF1_TUBBO|nr:mitochondrial 54S ribosomal protein YmL33 [Tuber borchii]